MSIPMTFSADRMLDNASTASQHLPLAENQQVRGAILRSMAQYLELNWACSSTDLIADLKQHPDWDN